MLEIFKKFEYFYNLKLQLFWTTLNKSLTLTTDFNRTKFNNIMIISFFKIKKEKNVYYVNLLVANQFYDYNFPFQVKYYSLI